MEQELGQELNRAQPIDTSRIYSIRMGTTVHFSVPHRPFMRHPGGDECLAGAKRGAYGTCGV